MHDSIIIRGARAFTRKLDCFAPLTGSDCDIIRSAFANARRHTVQRGNDIVFVRPPDVAVLAHGLAFRYRDTTEGKRQILSFVTPGDLLNPFGTVERLAHRVCAASRCTVVAFDQLGAFAQITRSGAVAAALQRSREFEVALLFERIGILGAFPAAQRIAAVLCAIHQRLEMAGELPKAPITVPLHQYELAQATGLTDVHVNRVIVKLVKSGALTRGNPITIGDMRELCRLAEWPPSYIAALFRRDKSPRT